MALNIGELTAHLSLDADPFKKGLGEAEKAVGSFSASLGGIGKLLLGISGAMNAMGMGAIKLASDVGETASLAKNAFGPEGAADVEAWAARTGEAMGRTTQQMRQFATGIQSVISPTMGMTAETAKMSKTLATLAVDLGSAFNVDDADALTALRSGLMGEAEPLKKFGIAMSEAGLKAYALSKGIRTNVETMTEAQKQALRYNFIIERSSIAHGDAVETAGSFANQMKAVQAAVTEVATRIGAVLLPVAQQVADQILHLVNYFKDLSPHTIQMGVAMAASAAKMAGMAGALFLITEKVLAFGAALRDFKMGGGGIMKILTSLGPIMAFAAALAGVIAMVLMLRVVWEQAGDSMKSSLSEAFKSVKEALGGFLQGILDAPLKMVSFLIDGFTKLAEALNNSAFAKKLGLGIDPKTIAELKETSDMLSKEHVDAGAALGESGKYLGDKAVEAAKVMKEGFGLVMKDIKEALKGTSLGNMTGEIGKLIEGFSAAWEKADPVAKRAAAQGSLTPPETVKIPGVEEANQKLIEMSIALGLFGVATQDATEGMMWLQGAELKALEMARAELQERKRVLDLQGKELQDGAGIAARFAVALRGSEVALKGGDWGNLIGDQAAAAVTGGLGRVDWTKVFAGAIGGGLKGIGQTLLSLATSGATAVSKHLNSPQMEGVIASIGGMAGKAVSAISKMSSETLGAFASFASGLASAVGDMLAEGVKMVASILSNAFESTAGFVGSNMIKDERLQGAMGAGMAAFTSLAAVVALVTLSFLALILSVVQIAITFGMLVPPIAGLVVTTSALLAALVVLTAGVIMVGAAMSGLAILTFALATKSKSYERFQKVIEAFVDRLVVAAEPFFRNLLPLAGLLVVAAEGFAQLIQVFVPGQIAARGLFDAFQLLLAGALNLGIAFLNVRIGLIEGVSALMQPFALFNVALTSLQLSISLAGVKIMELLDQLPGVNFSDEQWNTAHGAVDTANRAHGDAMTAVQNGMSPEMRALLATAQQDRDAAMGARDAVLGTTYAAMMDFANSIADATDKTKAMNESLTNVPSGYKVALARFNAMDPSAPNGGGGGGGGGGASDPGVVVQEETNVILQRIEDLLAGRGMAEPTRASQVATTSMAHRQLASTGHVAVPNPWQGRG